MIRTICLSVLLAAGALASLGQSIHAQTVQAVRTSPLAQDAPQVHAMLSGLRIYEILSLMAREHIAGGADLEAQLFPGQGGAGWQFAVQSLNDPDRMVALFEEAFDRDALTDEQITQVQRFTASDVGQRIFAGEVAAREAFLDDATVEAATEVLMAALTAEDPRVRLLQRFNEANGLIDRNVLGAMNMRFTFYRGLIDGGAFDEDVPEELMLADVWGQEPEVRQLTIEWLFAFQLMAYQDISDADLEAYLALIESPAGRALNAAMFDAFDEMLNALSYDLGRAAAGFVAGEET